MRPYLAIIVDSFREALSSRVLWILLALITVLLLALLPLGWQRPLTYRLGQGDIRRMSEFQQTLAKGETRVAKTPTKHIWDKLPEDLQAKLMQADSNRSLQQELANELTNLLEQDDFFDAEYWKNVDLNDEAAKLRDQGVSQLNEEQRRRFHRLALESAYPRFIRQTPSQSVLPTYLGYDIGFPFPLSDSQLEEAVDAFVAVFMYGLVGVIGLLVAILVTSFIIPNTFDSGSLYLLLSKPISRPFLYLAKFVGGCTFVLLNAAYLILGLWLLLGLRHGIWNHRILLCIPLYVFIFAIYYSVSGLAGLIWRNTVVCIAVTVVMWGICWAIGLAKGIVDLWVVMPNKVVQVMEDQEQVFASTNSGTVLRRDQQGEWNEVFANVDSGPAPPFVNTRIGPIYDSVNRRMVMVQNNWSSPSLWVATREDDWTGISKGSAPSGVQGLLNDADGRVALITRNEISRLVDQFEPENKLVEALQWLPLPNMNQMTQAIPLSPKPDRISTAAFDSDNQRILVWDGKTLSTYEQQDANYKLATEKNWSQDETDIVLAAGHGHAILATEQGQVAVLQADTLELVKEHTFPDDQPRFARVSPNGAYGAVLFHSGRLVVLDLKTGTPALSSIVPRRHNVTAIEFNDQQQLVMVRTGKRIETYDLGNASKIETDSLPYSVGENVARFGLDPVYKIFPKPGKVQDTISYVLTGKKTARIDEGGGLQAVQIEVDPWEPIWHGAVFIAVILTVSSLYIYRQDF